MLKPLNDRIIVKRDDNESVSAGGIVIPDVAQKKSTQGTVLAVGPGERLDDGTHAKMELSVGDKILFTFFAGDEVEIDGQKVCIMREKDVLTKVE